MVVDDTSGGSEWCYMRVLVLTAAQIRYGEY